MQHEQWLFGDKKYKLPVLAVIDEFMDMDSEVIYSTKE